ncbi:hypothetical protein APS56_14365 [Pseudalgibacter alginicilyticus]|uniref:NRDE family protein n=1 Tax=Pseudalgibacter alginicilyticus TaxID=1736674 RepID=A0A0P0CJ53_9FLAO|nr:NRDE family protein [Pseudalgibacter alginicilyticus]ALJ06247.1 hypothetical protein APS56_14365 [Pseudalgibacter alginicilyticus]
MCTVTIVPKGNDDFILTSNRDEAPNRVATLPDFYVEGTVKMLFPKDELSEGTWIGVSNKERLVCVLNGGFIMHQRELNYRKSRGVVAKDFMAFNNLEQEVVSYNFNNIEPFTMVIVDWNLNLRFFELVWDGQKSHFTKLPLKPKIWSSSTLYSQAMMQERTGWFEVFKTKNVLNQDSILQFHKTAGKDNNDYGVVMNRGFVKTTSITQVSKTNTKVEMLYENIHQKKVSHKTFYMLKTIND